MSVKKYEKSRIGATGTAAHAARTGITFTGEPVRGHELIDHGIAYVRSDADGPHSASLDRQRSAIRACAKADGVELVDEIVERVPVDRPVVARPALMVLNERITDLDIDCVYVASDEVFASADEESKFADLVIGRRTTVVSAPVLATRHRMVRGEAG